jgi:hypothetical protein
MVGGQTIGGGIPTRYVVPPDELAARKLVAPVRDYFDFGNHDSFKTLVNSYFQGGYPYEPHISGLKSDLDDVKTIRNACAHITSSTQVKLESLALRALARPSLGITVYQLLTALDRRSAGRETVFAAYKSKLLVAAELIANG